MIRLIGFALYGSKAASTRQRMIQYSTMLLNDGIKLEVHSLLDNDYLNKKFSNSQISIINIISAYYSRIKFLSSIDHADLLIIHCELFPFFPHWVEKLLIRFPYIYDFDDAFFLKYKNGIKKIIFPFLRNKFKNTIKGASYVLAGSPFLYSYAVTINKKTTLFPTVVDVNKYSKYTHKLKSNSEFTIGWIGSPSTSIYLDILVEPLAKLGLEGDVVFVVIGAKSPYIKNITIKEVEWDLKTEIKEISKFDVGVMPLDNTDWAKGKCAYKLIQYLGCSIPVIASRIGANIDVVTSDVGFLVNNSSEWLDAFRFFRDHDDMRKKYGTAGRNHIVKNYSLVYNYKILKPVLSSLNILQKNFK